MNMCDIEIGKKYAVVNVNCNKKTKERLEGIGLTKGSIITLVRKSPLMDPVEIKVNNFYLAIRIKDSKNITVIENG